MQLIDKKQAMSHIESQYHQWGDDYDILQAIGDLEDMETVDAVPVRHGKWIKLDMHEHLADHKCTACGQECYVPTCMGEPMYTYCPNCGAKMGDTNHDKTD